MLQARAVAPGYAGQEADSACNETKGDIRERHGNAALVKAA